MLQTKYEALSLLWQGESKVVIVEQLLMVRSLGTMITNWACTFDFCSMEQTVEPVGRNPRMYWSEFLNKVPKKLIARETSTSDRNRNSKSMFLFSGVGLKLIGIETIRVGSG